MNTKQAVAEKKPWKRERKTKPAPWTTTFPDQLQRPAKSPKEPARGVKSGRVTKRIGKSDAQKAKDKIYRAIAAEFMARAENQLCAVCHQPATLFGPMHVHHVRGRAGALLFATRFFRIVHDHPCHDWIHANPAQARIMGLLAQRGDWGRQEQ